MSCLEFSPALGTGNKTGDHPQEDPCTSEETGAAMDPELTRGVCACVRALPGYLE